MATRNRERRTGAAAQPQARAKAELSNRGAFLPRLLLAPADIAGLVFFRIALGVLLLIEMGRFLVNGWVIYDFVTPPYHFTYYGFSWVKPLPAAGMVALFVVLAACAILIALGLKYRLACVVFCVGFSYAFLIERSLYLNHFYLICLWSGLMAFVPANRAFSLDARLDPGIASQIVPSWSLWLLRFQIAIPYFYGGLAKLNGDWLYGQPLQMWMGRMDGLKAVLPAFGEPWLAVLFSWCGLLLDLFVVPLLIWRPTRPYAFAAAICFHLMNSLMWRIGIFPWFMIAATTLYLEPDWPRRLLAWLAPGLRERLQPPPETAHSTPDHLSGRNKLFMATFAVFAAFQLLFPLRHFLYPGNVDWTEEGSQFAWRMMLNDKTAAIQFFAVDPSTGAQSGIDIRPYLTRRQLNKMSQDPAMIRDFAEFLASELERERGKRYEVHTLAYCTLNGRLPQLLVDPRVDLSRQPRSWKPASWIVPLEQPRQERAFELPPGEWARFLQPSAGAVPQSP